MTLRNLNTLLLSFILYLFLSLSNSIHDKVIVFIIHLFFPSKFKFKYEDLKLNLTYLHTLKPEVGNHLNLSLTFLFSFPPFPSSLHLFIPQIVMAGTDAEMELNMKVTYPPDPEA